MTMRRCFLKGLYHYQLLNKKMGVWMQDKNNKAALPKENSFKEMGQTEVGWGTREAGNPGTCSVHLLTPYSKITCFDNDFKGK